MAENFLKQIQEKISDSLKNTSYPIAAFDADGTLWPTDVGKGFFHYQAKKNVLKDKDPLGSFNRIRDQYGKNIALRFPAQAQAGLSLDQLNEIIAGFFKENPLKVFVFQKKLIEWLHQKNIPVFIVSASLKWVLDYALKSYPIPKENIIGVQTLVEKGVITDKLVLPASIHKDKPLALKKHTEGRPPLFASGNTLSDQALLESATGISLVVASTKEGERNWESERKLLQLAKERSWLYQDKMPELMEL